MASAGPRREPYLFRRRVGVTLRGLSEVVVPHALLNFRLTCVELVDQFRPVDVEQNPALVVGPVGMFARVSYLEAWQSKRFEQVAKVSSV